jgi:hypothetical protein
MHFKLRGGKAVRARAAAKANAQLIAPNECAQSVEVGRREGRKEGRKEELEINLLPSS